MTRIKYIEEQVKIIENANERLKELKCNKYCVAIETGTRGIRDAIWDARMTSNLAPDAANRDEIILERAGLV